MKKLIIAAAAAVSAFAMAAPASAEMYVNLGYSDIDWEDVRLGGPTMRLGWQSGSWYGVEGEATFGSKDDDVAGVNVELESSLALYGTATMPLGENMDLFARVGWGTHELDTSVGSGSDDSWNYGVGAQVFFAGDNGVRLDYTQYDLDSGDDASSWSLAYVRRF